MNEFVGVTSSELDRLIRGLEQRNPRMIELLHADNSDDPYGVSMEKLASLQVMFHACKDEGYGRSWAKRGEMNAYNNTMRKADRLERLGVLTLGGDLQLVKMVHHVALVDALMDLSTYAQMWVSLIAKLRPHVFEMWLRSVWCASTGITYEDVVSLLDEV